jgi:uncharacterized protein
MPVNYDPTRTHLDSILDGNLSMVAPNTWSNQLTGYGTTRDKTQYGQWSGYQPTDLLTLSSLFHGSDLAARIVEAQPEEELRLPYKICTGDDNLDAELAVRLEEIELRNNFLEARIWGRCFGGCALVLGSNDGGAADQPLRLERVRDLPWLSVVDRRFLWPVQWYQKGPKAGTPEKYVVSNTWTGVTSGAYTLHETRMVKLPGARTARREKLLNSSWDFSILDKVIPQIRALETIYKGTEILVIDGPQGVYKVKNLMDQILAGNEAGMVKRFELVEMFRSSLRAILIDADQESFERQQVAYSGIPEILTQFQRRLCSAVQTPMLILFGQQQSGLTGNNDNDLRWYYNLTETNQQNLVKPRLLRVAKVMLAAMGRADRIPHLTVEFASLWSPTAKEQAEEQEIKARTDRAYVESGVLTPEEVALSRFKKNGKWAADWSAVNRETREKMLEDVMRNLQAGSEPGIPGELGRTPTAQDVRGTGQDLLEKAVVSGPGEQDPSMGTNPQKPGK